jgi:hypothetical protein
MDDLWVKRSRACNLNGQHPRASVWSLELCVESSGELFKYFEDPEFDKTNVIYASKLNNINRKIILYVNPRLPPVTPDNSRPITQTFAETSRSMLCVCCTTRTYVRGSGRRIRSWMLILITWWRATYVSLVDTIECVGITHDHSPWSQV